MHNPSQDFAEERRRMVETQLIRRGIHDPRVLAALGAVPRHLFVPEESIQWAYADSPQPIGFDQTISQPYIVALMSQSLNLTGSERVLEVGTGSGYQAAILAQLAAEVHSIELIPQLAERATRTLASLGLTNLHIHCANGSLGWPESAPYEAILVAAAASQVPPPLLKQLADHGRMILPVGPPGAQQLEYWWRVGDTFEYKVLLPVAFVPLRGAGTD
jgi:protein-L-isoaspartate(D-aspartate) O-methyltransferase